MIHQIPLGTITCVGEDGAAAGSVTSSRPIAGRLLAVHADYSAGQAATTDLVIATTHAPVVTLLTLTDNKTDGWYYPRQQVCGATGTALTLDGTRIMVEPVPICDYVSATVAQGDGTETVAVTLIVEE